MSTDLFTAFKERRDALATRSKWLIGLAAIPVVIFSWFLAQAVLGLAALGGALALAGAIGLAIVHGAPALSMRFANWKLADMKAQAEKNPIETLQNRQKQLEESLDAEAKAITDFDSEVENFRSSLQAEVEKGFPEEAMGGLPTLRNMERLREFRRVKFKKARAKMLERRRHVARAESKYRVALAAQRVTAASGEVQNTVLQQILEDIAFNTVDSAVNASMAELRTAIMLEDVPVDDSDVIEMPSIPALEMSSKLDLQELRRQLQPVPIHHEDLT